MRDNHQWQLAFVSWLRMTAAAGCVVGAFSLTLAQIQVSGGGGGGGARGPVGQSPTSVRYGNPQVYRPQTRLLPSEQRGVAIQAGMLPSERRAMHYQSGALPSQGRIAPPVGSSLRYSNYGQIRAQTAAGYRVPPSVRYSNVAVQPALAYQRQIAPSTQIIQYNAITQKAALPQAYPTSVRYGQVSYRR
jgi:hypothetical protein